MPASALALSELEQDALREVANIGTGHACTSLSAMTGQTFRMTSPHFGVVSAGDYEGVLGDLEAVGVSAYMPVYGDAPGHVAFIFPFAKACLLADIVLMQEPGQTEDLGEMELSALTEVGNILVSSFLNAISEMTGLTLTPEPPGVAVDMVGSILACLAAASPELGDHALTIMTQLTDCEQPIEGAFIYIPEPQALKTLFGALGME
jgi:chemotaxis protein CheC